MVRVETFSGDMLACLPKQKVGLVKHKMLEMHPSVGNAKVKTVKLFHEGVDGADGADGVMLDDEEDTPDRVLCRFVFYKNWLEEALSKYPDWKWDMYGLSRHPNLTMEFVEAHLDWKWDFLMHDR